MYFLALSQAPPALAMKSARKTPMRVAPARKPPSASLPMTKPMTGGSTTADSPGHDHLLERRARGDLDAAGRVGLRRCPP